MENYKIYLEPKEKAEIVFTLDKTAFSFFNDKENLWVSEEGELEILVAASSRDIRLKESFILDKTLKYL